MVALTALAGASAYLAVRSDPKVYERTVSFVLGPSGKVAPERVPDTIRSLEEDGAMVQTVRGLLGSALFLDLAADEANRELGPDYSMSASIRPGSNILDARINGPNPDVLAEIGDELPDVAADWVNTNYRVYELSFLESDAPAGPVLPRVGQTTAFAAVVGFMLAVAAVFAEGLVRAPRREERPLEEAPQAEPAPAAVAVAPKRTARTRREDGRAERRAASSPPEIHIAELSEPAATAAAPRRRRGSGRSRQRSTGTAEPPRADA